MLWEIVDQVENAQPPPILLLVTLTLLHAWPGVMGSSTKRLPPSTLSAVTSATRQGRERTLAMKKAAIARRLDAWYRGSVSAVACLPSDVT